MHHPLTGIRPTFLHPSSSPRSSFSQGATSHALGKQTSTEQLQKTSMKSKLFGNKPPLHTGTPTGTPTGLQHAPHPQNRHTHPALLASFLLSPPSSFPPSSFFSRHHFPCSWQTNTNTAISERFE